MKRFFNHARAMLLASIALITGHAYAGVEQEFASATYLVAQLQASGAVTAEQKSLLASQQARFSEIAKSSELTALQLSKAATLAQFLRYLQEDPKALSTRSKPIPEISLLGGSPPQCESALTINPGDELAFLMPPKQSLWLRVNLPMAHGVALNTRGSAIDTRLSAFVDCQHTEPFVIGDDNYGLTSEIAIAQAKQLFWLVRVDNLSENHGSVQLRAALASTLTGTVTSQRTGLPLQFHVMNLFRAQSPTSQFANFETATTTNAQGIYTLAITNVGTFALKATSNSFDNVLAPAAYDKKRCRDNYPYSLEDCGTAGARFTPISVVDNVSTTVNMTISDSSTIAGTITSRVDGTPIRFARVVITNEFGSYLREAQSDFLGRYRVTGILNERVFAQVQSNGHYPQLFENIECPFQGCNSVSGGTPIMLANGEERRIDFRLRPAQSVEIAFNVSGQSTSFSFNNYWAALVNSNGVPVASSQISVQGNSGTIKLGPVEAGTYKLKFEGSTIFVQLYNGVICASDCLAEINQGTSVIVEPGVINTTVTANLRALPKLTVNLVDADTNAPITSSGSAELYTLQGFSYSSQLTANGAYEIRGIRPGTYALMSRALRYNDELYDNIECERSSPLANCPGATFLTFDANSTDRTLVVPLQRSASIKGRIQVDQSFNSTNFYLLSANGQIVGSSFVQTNANGEFELTDVPTGVFRMAVVNFDFQPQIYPGVACSSAANGSFTSCDLTNAQAVVVNSGQVISGIDFNLRRNGAKEVRVRNANGAPLSDIAIDVWDAARNRVDVKLTNATGITYVGGNQLTLLPYYLSTDNSRGYQNEVYNNIACPLGSAFFGLCNPLVGESVVLPDQLSPPAIFSLDTPNFASGFE